VHNLALAGDVVQDAFCRGMEVWSVHGVLENPSALRKLNLDLTAGFGEDHAGRA
jgi:predicted RNA polymerase sigma factor